MIAEMHQAAKNKNITPGLLLRISASIIGNSVTTKDVQTQLHVAAIDTLEGDTI